MKAKGLSIHIAASYVVGRRCLGFKDKVPKNIKHLIPKDKLQNHHWSHWRQLSTKFKSIPPHNFYKNIDKKECDSIKVYAQLLM